MKKLLILALTSAFVAAANAADVSWFSANADGSTTADWSSQLQVKDGVISVDEDVGTALALTPKEGNTAPAPQVKTVVTVEATFTAVSDSLESLTGTDAKTALTVQTVNNTPRYRYWDGNSWEELNDSVVAVTNAPVGITIELDNDTVGKTTVAFKVVKKSDSTTVLDESVDLTTDGTEKYLTRLAFAGTGSLTSVAATVTPAYAEYAGTRYETTAAAVAARGDKSDNITMYAPVEAGKYDLYDNANKKIYYTSTSGNTTTLAGVFPASGDGTKNNPWKIGSLAELKAFQVYVATNYPTAGKYFQQTAANITLDAAWPGIGIQNGKDLAYDKDTTEANIAAYDAGAFQGTYDGCNYTISNFKMDSGLDYCGFFNSTKDATIKNLTIEYASDKFTDGSASNTSDCGATFVGVTKSTTLENLTANMPNGVEVVQSGKGIGGIVGYLANNSTVSNCVNNVNLKSLANNKVGGIAMICQKSGCSILDCVNNGTTTTSSGEFGGIIGYTDTITISDCENTAACKMFYHHDGTVTFGGENKGNATVASYTGKATPGLNFATVDGDVATFVADNALAAGNTYKVMAEGATATYAFTAAGTIAFDTALLATPPTYAITAATGLVAKSTTSENVTTYTADEGYEVVSTAKTTLVSVPKDCKAAELIDLSNRAEGDVLKAYNATTERYYTWVLAEVESDLVWEVGKVFVTSADESTAESNKESADTYQLKAGQAVWLTRENPNATIKLAVAADGPVKVDVGIGYNLVAPPPAATAYDATSLKVAEEGSFDNGDQIVVPTTTAPLSYTRKDGAWKVLSGEPTTPAGLPEGWGVVADPAWTEASKIEIPSGQGFWFNSKKAKKLEF